MIWVVMLVLMGLIGIYLMQPFLSDDPGVSDPHLTEARAQRTVIDRDEAEGRLTETAAAQARDALDRRVLAILDATPKAGGMSDLRSLAIFLVPAILLLGVASIYVRVGSPSFQPVTMEEYRAAQTAELPQSLDALVVELRKRLEADPNPPAEGYVLLARSYLRLSQIEAALEAYDVAIAVSDGNPDVIAERDRVIAVLQERAAAPQMGAEAAARIQAMSQKEQSAMIESMVEGLAARLAQDSSDAQGWARLIRARLVLGQIEQARQDLETAQAALANDPDRLSVLEPLARELAQSE